MYRITPFGNLRVKGYVLLTAAFRSLSRPSSSYSSTDIRHKPIFHLTILSFPSCSSSYPLLVSLKIYVKCDSLSLASKQYVTFIALLEVFTSFKLNVSFLHFYFQRTMELLSFKEAFLVENRGFEPLTLGLQSRCSSQLS